eukprot:CAMPEP_0181173812 /NCGR_PEP_ID=MMETSP1096-20121128/3198_1 /TAXON_ID=156174 ORGANISM="Chrysochromulina ericina, Strain CCMP281" /NCGR_SAMPLE_ID=MMETSP1096 /ASSEMBLY_ACC=CAM_ASM_000453 /LENGTH=185 /DNA_ID=CAMNT_0023261663 /DNA_START=259 /DNA_END=817 /DNA_ORIENTATION=-
MHSCPSSSLVHPVTPSQNTTPLPTSLLVLVLFQFAVDAAEYQPFHRVADLFVKRSKLLLRLQAYSYRLQYVLPRSDWQGPHLQQLQAELTEGRMKTDTFTDRFGTYPDLPYVEDIPSVCQADRCTVLEAQINALQVKILTYRSHLGNALAHFAVYPRPRAYRSYHVSFANQARSIYVHSTSCRAT